MEQGYVVALNRPGGNLTGVMTLNGVLSAKRIELIHELIPGAKSIAVFANPANSGNSQVEKISQTAADSLGLELHIINVINQSEIEAGFATLLQLHAGALVIITDPFLLSQSETLAASALRHAVPAIFEYRPFATAGGLMSYGSDFIDQYRLIGVYTGQILEGESPANLPVVQSSKVELIINLKTAKALGLTFPLSLLGRADDVIE